MSSLPLRHTALPAPMPPAEPQTHATPMEEALGTARARPRVPALGPLVVAGPGQPAAMLEYLSSITLIFALLITDGGIAAAGGPGARRPGTRCCWRSAPASPA